MDYAFGRSVQAEKLHQNALSISICMRDLERQLASTSPDVALMEKIAIEYEQTICATQVNHTAMDFTRWTYNSATPDGIVTAIWYPVRRVLFNIWFYLSSMFMYLFLLTATIVPTIWYTYRFVIPQSFWQ